LAESPDSSSVPSANSELSADNEVALELALWDKRQGRQHCRARILPRAVSGRYLCLARPNTA
jgi:hypothetical protein